MNDLRTAAQQALERLRKYHHGNGFAEDAECIADLEAALAQQDEPVEPVAWSGYDLDGMVEALSRVVEAHYQRANPFQNPIDMDAQMALRILRGFIPAMKAYTAPPQRKQAEPLNLADPAVRKRLATQWGYVPAALAEPVEPVAGRAFLERILTAMEGVIDVADRKTDEFDALRSCVIDLTLMLHTAPPQRKPLTEEEIESCRQQGYAHAGLGAPFDFGKAARAVERAHGIKE